ncbi:hypothetical protein M0804_000008 [Polistes exclamans]|nr:hypothetical protein M0804_000008 [Polistes exclamans]
MVYTPDTLSPISRRRVEDRGGGTTLVIFEFTRRKQLRCRWLLAWLETQRSPVSASGPFDDLVLVIRVNLDDDDDDEDEDEDNLVVHVDQPSPLLSTSVLVHVDDNYRREQLLSSSYTTLSGFPLQAFVLLLTPFPLSNGKRSF